MGAVEGLHSEMGVLTVHFFFEGDFDPRQAARGFPSAKWYAFHNPLQGSHENGNRVMRRAAKPSLCSFALGLCMTVVHRRGFKSENPTMFDDGASGGYPAESAPEKQECRGSAKSDVPLQGRRGRQRLEAGMGSEAFGKLKIS